MTDLTIQDLEVHYGAVRAVRGVSFDVADGSALGLVGESGSGKSTVARAVVGLAESAGAMRLGGVDIAASSRTARRQRRKVQLIFQDSRSSLDPRFTVEQCVMEGLDRSASGNRRDAAARVAELLEMVSLDPAVGRSRPGNLSGGQRQRVAIARALAAQPEVLIADEVTASLDVSVQAVVLNLLRRLQHELGLTMIFISHNLAVVRYMCDDLAVMFNGRIVEFGSVEGVIEAPEHPYTRSLLAAVPEVGERRLLSDSALEAAIGDPAPPGGCDYHLRCPAGPIADPDRSICLTADPTTEARSRAHRAACHFARRPAGV
ncbi:ABC transporter ATP-binding protein [Pseudonocardia sp. MH-G8]|uniref:ABC transporter ATP-binding protein n=1 Tax=Pseudonocardia sp. MH-G8 TaxID=1854588 RepID=UPI000B9FCECE|nr:ABC transporter ATP-binding protein [Pseudonocardia sp. MH-G8]OZM83228.1 dipeptide/oligopeptide/nickel ABC transporter ATP-binding protein [Pseudonocardia sp. MH-G8]